MERFRGNLTRLNCGEPVPYCRNGAMSEVGQPFEDSVSNPLLSPEDRGREVALRFPLLCTSASRGRIAKALAWGYVPRAQRALAYFDNLGDAQAAFMPLKEGLRLITAELTAIASGSQEEGPVAEVLLDQGAEIERDRGRWKALVQSACDGREERESEKLERAFSKLTEGMSVLGSDRLEYWSEARATLEDLVATNAQAPTCLALGFLRERLVENQFEAEQAYMNGVLEGVRRRDLAFILCGRQMANIQFRTGRFDAALGTIERVLHARVDADALVDVGRYSAAAKQASRSKEAWHKALTLHPLAIIDLLGEEDPPTAAALDLAVTFQTDLRRAAQTAGDQVAEALTKVEDAEKRLGEILEIPSPVREAAKQTSNFENANLYVALSGRQEAELRRTSLLSEARQKLMELASTSRAQCESARSLFEATQSQRDQALEQAKATFVHSETQAREAMERQLRESNLQKGCNLSAGAGCGMFVLYIVATLVTSGMGIKIGPETALGKILLGLVALPIALGAIMQVAAGMKKAALEAEMVAALKEAQERYQQSQATLGDRFNPRLNELHEALQRSEANRRRAEEALQAFI